MTDTKLRHAVVSGFDTTDGEVTWHVKCFTCGWGGSYSGGVGQRGAQLEANEHNRRAHGDLCCVARCDNRPTMELEVSYDFSVMDPYTLAGVTHDGTLKVERLPLQFCAECGDQFAMRVRSFPSWEESNNFSLLGWSHGE